MSSQRSRSGGFLDQQREAAPWADRLEELQRRFLANLAAAASQSRAYRDIYARAGVDPRDIRSLDDLHLLPVLRTEDLLRRQEEDPPFGGFETLPMERFHRIYVNPGFLMRPGESGYRDPSWAEALAAGGIQNGDRVLNTFSYHLWPYAHMLDASARLLGAVVVPTGGGNAFMQVRIMRKLGVKAYLGTPSFLMTLAQRAQALGLDPTADLSLEAAVVGAEMLPESLRVRLEATLGITVRQAYGTVYVGCLGYECMEGQGLHVPEGMLVEVVDPLTGRPQPPGAAGEVVASNLSPTYPMIRMATGDLSQWAQGECPCGRSAPRLQRVLGRVDQAVKVRGVFIHPWQIDEALAGCPEVFKCQAAVSRQQDQDRLSFLVELKDGEEGGLETRRRLENELYEFLAVKGEVEIVPRGTIPDFHGKIVDRRKWD